MAEMRSRGTPAPQPSSPPFAAPAEAPKSALASRIKKAAPAPEGIANSQALAPAQAGDYRVLHGSVHFGYEKDEKGNVDPSRPVTANKGSIVTLTGQDAALMLAEGVVERV